MDVAKWLIYAWLPGITFTFAGFIVKPRSQAPIFYLIGIPCLIAAAFFTHYLINAPKREAEVQRNKKILEQREREKEEKTLAHMVGFAKFRQMNIIDRKNIKKALTKCVSLA